MMLFQLYFNTHNKATSCLTTRYDMLGMGNTAFVCCLPPPLYATVCKIEWWDDNLELLQYKKHTKSTWEGYKYFSALCWL